MKSNSPNHLCHRSCTRSTVTGVGVLDLDRRAPLNVAAIGNNPLLETGAPVWRIAISERHDAGSTFTGEDPTVRRDQRPDTASFDLFEPDEVDSSVVPAASLNYDRFILFNDFAEHRHCSGQCVHVAGKLC